jgi:hypothetical protein
MNFRGPSSVVGGALGDPFSDRVTRSLIERLFVARHRVSAIPFVALRVEHAMAPIELAHEEAVVRSSGFDERHRLKPACSNVDEREMNLLGIIAAEEDAVRISGHRSVTRRERAAVLEDRHDLSGERDRRATRIDGRIEVLARASFVTLAADDGCCRRSDREEESGGNEKRTDETASKRKAHGFELRLL